MHIVITGSRHWSNVRQIERELRRLKEEHGSYLQIAHGKSKGGGVDLYVEEICKALGIDQTPFPVLPRDGKHRGAPLNRNKRMILGFIPQLVLGFRAAGKSNGTDQALAYAETLGIPTKTVEEELN